MSWRETASKGCRSVQGYFSRKTNEENTSLPAQSNPDGNAGCSRRTAEEEVNLLPRKRSRSSVSSNGVPMNMRDCLRPLRNAFNAQTSAMSAEPGVLAGDREHVRQCHGRESQPPTCTAQDAVLRDIDTRPIIPKDPDTANEVFGNLGPFVDRRLRESGFEHGLADFIGNLRRLSREYHDANIEEEVFSAREASQRYFSNDENSSSEDLGKLYSIWDHCRGLSDDMRRSKLGEITLSDENLETYLPIEVALLALLSCSFDGGLDEMYEAFLKVYKKTPYLISECVDALISDKSSKLWRRGFWREEDCATIPREFADALFPSKGVNMLEFVPEGLSMSYEKILCTLLHFDKIEFSIDAREWGALFCSHVLTWDAGKKIHVLTEDFFFNSLPLGYNRRMVYVTTEGRCITNVPNAAFLTPNTEGGLLGIRFAKCQGSCKRFLTWWQVVAMAKYNLTLADLEFLISINGLSVDHLSINHAYGQPSMLQLATRVQQAVNKRSRKRETFRCESVSDDPLYVSFDDLDDTMRRIAEACKNDRNKPGLALAVIEEKVTLEAIRAFVKDESSGSGNSQEIWRNLMVDDSILLFEEQKCIWRMWDDHWIFLDRHFKTTRTTPYRSIAVSRRMCGVHMCIYYTKMYHQVKSGSPIEVDGLGVVARVTSHTLEQERRVEIKMYWEKHGSIQRLVIDHIDQNKGNNDPDNLRVLDNRTNTVAACGIPTRVLVHPFVSQTATEVGSASILVETNCICDIVKKIKDAMSDLGYPQEYQNYEDSTILKWIYSGGITCPRLLQSKIEIIAIDGEEHDDEEDSGCFQKNRSGHSSMWWYGVEYENRESGMKFVELVIGKWPLAKLVEDLLRVQQVSTSQLNEKLRDFVFHPDHAERRVWVNSTVQKLQSDDRKYNITDIYCLFRSSPSIYVFDVTWRTQVYSCSGLKEVVMCLKQNEILMKRLLSYLPKGESPNNDWLIGLVRAYLRNVNGNSLLHEEGIRIDRRTKRNVVVNSRKYSLRFVDNDNYIQMNAKEVQKRLSERLAEDFNITTVQSWLSSASGESGIHESLKRIGIVEILQPSSAMDKEYNGSKVIVEYTSMTCGSVFSKPFKYLGDAVRFVFEILGFGHKFEKMSSLKKRLLSLDAQPLDNDLYRDVFLRYDKGIRDAACRSLYAIVDRSDKNKNRLARSISHSLPDFVLNNADHINRKLPQRPIPITVNELERKMNKGDLECLEFVGYFDRDGRSSKCFSNYLKARGVNNADEKILRMQKSASYYKSPLGQDVPWCHHVFTPGLTENAKRSKVTSFKARAYLIKYDKDHILEQELVEENLNRFLLHKLKGHESVSGLRLVKEEMGPDGWVDLVYENSESNRHADTPRNKMIREMMSRLGLEPPERPAKRNGFLHHSAKKTMYCDSQGNDGMLIPFLYKHIIEREYFLLVASKE